MTKSLWILFCGPVETRVFVALYAVDAEDVRGQASAWMERNHVKDVSLVAYPEGYSWKAWGVPGDICLPGTVTAGQ